jgi:metal-responsive CopG/Arc/MetJ family transcriptional regulator
MEIISVSMDKETLGELDSIQEKLGFKSRSRLLRATINSLLNEYKVIEGSKGHCDAVFTVTHRHDEGTQLGKVMKRYDDIIRTEVHQHHEGMCLRVLIACGDSKKISELFSALKREKGVRAVNCSVL